MNDYTVDLKNIYRILRINDYPLYSNGVMPMSELKGLTLVKFWTQFLLFRWRNTEHGRIIWRTAGSKNRYHSELCNRKTSFPFYSEYSKEILSRITEQEIFDQIELFMDFLESRRYSHDNFLKKLQFFLDAAHKHDNIFNKEASGYFLKSLSFYNNTVSPVMIDAWFLTMLTIHALAGESMNSVMMSRIRRDVRFSPDQLLLNTDNKDSSLPPGSPLFLTHGKCTLQYSGLSSYHFYGRQQDLFDLKDAHHINKKLLINGIDGIGKTELLRQYVSAIIKHNVSVRFAFIQYEGNITESFSRSFSGLSCTSAGERFLEAIRILSGDPINHTIILIDNMNNPDEDHETLEILSQLPCTVIITSTLKQLPGFTTYTLTDPDLNTASLIFRNNYDKVLSEKEKGILLQFLKRNLLTHPLILKLLGKYAGHTRISIEELNQTYRIPEKEINDNHNSSCICGHLSYILEKLYNDTDLSETEKKVLRLLSMLPYRDYDPEEIYSFSGSEDYGLIKSILEKLDSFGLLYCNKSGYSMHPLIASYINKDSASEDEFSSFWQRLGDKLKHSSGEDSSDDMFIAEETAWLILLTSNKIMPHISNSLAKLCVRAYEVLKQSVHFSEHLLQLITAILSRCENFSFDPKNL